MELYLNKKNDGISVDIDFDELIDQYGQQLIEAIAKRKKIVIAHDENCLGIRLPKVHKILNFTANESQAV